MSKKIRVAFLLFALFIITSRPAQGEKISLRFSYKSNSISKGDINTWINSYNLLWKDWQQRKGGNLEGQFDLLRYRSNFEVELRIPIIAGLAINLGGGSPINSEGEGTIYYQNDALNQNEAHFIRNEINAFPLKIGFSYSYPLPFLSNLYVFTNFGRYLMFVRYKTKENYEANFTSFGEEFYYQFEKENKFRSESLGYYGSLGVEYDLIKYIGFVIEAEKIWSKVDGFKGPYSFKQIQQTPLDYEETNESGKASLYYYQSNKWDLDQYYSVLSGHKEKPENSYVRNIRQGKLNFSGFSLKIGIRFKF